MSTDYIDELAALGDGSPPQALTLTQLVEDNPVPAVLAAAAVGAGLMALVSMMGRRAPDPFAPVPLVTARGIDYDALKRQIADIADRVARAMPVDAAKHRVEDAGEAIADGWSMVREQALDALHRFEPRASAAVKVARENPIWTSLVVGAIGALLSSQLLGKPAAEVAETPLDPSADA